MRETARPAELQPSWAQRIASGWTTFRNVVLNVVGAVVFLGAAWLLYDAVTKPTIAIAPISVPEELQKKGYTPEVMAHKLRAAVAKLIKEAKSVKGGADIASPSEIPDIVVPHTGLSVETIAAQIRKIFGRTNRWQVSGGVAAKDDLYEMDLRIANEVESKPGREPIRQKDVEQLTDTSAREILRGVDPYLLAAFYHSVGNEQVSLDIAQKIVEQNPQAEAAFWAHNLIGIIYSENLHELDAASKELRASINFQPAKTLMHTATVVISDWLFGMALDKSYSIPHNGLGIVLRHQGKSGEAIVEFKKAIELDPKDATPHSGLGVVLGDQGKPGEAIAEFKKAIELDPKYAAPHSNLGNVLRNQGKPDEAITEYKEAIQLDPKNAAPHNGLGVALGDQGKFDEAIAAFKKAIELDPTDAFPHANLGNVLLGQGKPDNAINEYKEAIELAPRIAGLHYNLGNVLRDQGKHEDAVAEYQKAVELAPDNILFKVNLDRALEARREAQGRIGESKPAEQKRTKK
jgi:Flp pilus assembly protein TadD